MKGKKKYFKPQILFEKFEMSQQIAACDYDSNNTSTDEKCTFTGINKDFNETMNILVIQGVCDVIEESYCYHNAISGEYGIFNS